MEINRRTDTFLMISQSLEATRLRGNLFELLYDWLVASTELQPGRLTYYKAINRLENTKLGASISHGILQ